MNLNKLRTLGRLMDWMRWYLAKPAPEPVPDFSTPWLLLPQIVEKSEIYHTPRGRPHVDVQHYVDVSSFHWSWPRFENPHKWDYYDNRDGLGPVYAQASTLAKNYVILLPGRTDDIAAAIGAPLEALNRALMKESNALGFDMHPALDDDCIKTVIYDENFGESDLPDPAKWHGIDDPSEALGMLHS